MVNYKVRTGGKLSVIEDYENGGTITTKTFTITSDDFDKTSEYILIIDGCPTAALALQFEINGKETAYYQDGRRQTGGTETLLDIDNASEGTLASASILNAAVPFHTVMHISYADAATTPKMLGTIDSVAGMGGHESYSFQLNSSGPLTEIIIQVSTSSLKVGCHMTLYKLAR